MEPTITKRREYDPVISLRLPRDLVARFDAVEEETGITRSALLRLALRQGLGVLANLAPPPLPPGRPKGRSKR